MYTTYQIAQAMNIWADPKSTGVATRWAEDVVTWAEKHLTEWEKQSLIGVHRDHRP